MGFIEKLKNKWEEGKYVCVGLDPITEKLPEGISGFFEFNKAIIDATHDIVASYKPNSAFYEALGSKGIDSLKMTIEYIASNYPDDLIILDAKRGDIGNTNDGYVKFAYNYLQADSITLHPYMGREALLPFLNNPQKGAFILCKTSNPGSGEFQDLTVNDKKIYQIVAQNVSSSWNTNKNCGLVVGATYPNELEKIREIDQDIPILIPGIGAQGGELAKTVNAAQKNFLISASRGIIFASNGPDFAEAARAETERLDQQIRGLI